MASKIITWALGGALAVAAAAGIEAGTAQAAQPETAAVSDSWGDEATAGDAKREKRAKRASARSERASERASARF